jgi:hypothetical protein
MSGQARKADDKGRVLLPDFANARVLVEKISESSYLVTRAAVVPEPIAWFYKNRAAQERVKVGLEDIQAGRVAEFVPGDTAFLDEVED